MNIEQYEEFQRKLLNKAERDSRMWQRRAIKAEKALRELQNKIAADAKKSARKTKKEASK